MPGAPGMVRDLGNKEEGTRVLASERRTWFSNTQPLTASAITRQRTEVMGISKDL